MFAKIARMMRRVYVTDEDLKLTEQALRSLAVRYRDIAKRHENPIVRQGFEMHAADCERRPAERMGRFRDV